ncbi:hypothetical protein BP5796_05555 [Coleophoma crateriformis]|uniref:Nucleoside 2-deoxyribosyltransferase like protein n=1 Tax=Coleophoma crateriformis TaxID=565419 RepID=A0A3D8S3H1_9HELO|nr:hypothetical protein BP5796_05555 [Coleophoma crateriformis]
MATSNFTIITATARAPIIQPSIFLAGAISGSWHKDLTNRLSHLPVTILNPLRTDWEAIGEEDIANPEFRKQTEWEMDMQAAADLVVIYFAPEKQAPVSLLELGVCAASRKGTAKEVVICCPKGYWKRGNVQMVCEQFRIKVTEDLEEFFQVVEERMRLLCEK